MLDGYEERLVVRGKTGAAHLRADGNAVKVARGSAQWSVGLDAPDAVIAAGRLIGIAIGRDPQAALVVEGNIVRHPEPAVPGRLRGVHRADRRDRGIAALEHDLPAKWRGA